ncbi:MAG: hypothetical protein HY314_09615 [Acidobacteria bacterium]|nr:hypothetical protein [Acidobacteriota bacterium]
MNQRSLNAVYSKPTMRRRYEVWFLRFMLADGSGAWWFRYLLMNPGRPGGGGCPGNPRGMPVQVWATWFPRDATPVGYIQGFPPDQLSLSRPGAQPFFLRIGDNNRIDEDSCVGRIEVEGHLITWDLRYRSTFGVAMTNVGWIGFSRTPHSDAIFSGEVAFDGQTFRGEPLGYGLQGHNCGFRHRHYWNWTHCIMFPSGGGISTFEALEYEIPLGLQFRKALLWHGGKLYTFTSLEEIYRDREHLQWMFKCSRPDGVALIAIIDGRGPAIHWVPYLKTDCSSTFNVANNSLARATLYLSRPGHPLEQMSADGGAALEMVGTS